MANIFIYTGLAILLIGVVFGFVVAVKGYRATDWHSVKKISYRGMFQRGEPTPQMKTLIRIWGAVMILGFIITGIGLAIGLD